MILLTSVDKEANNSLGKYSMLYISGSIGLGHIVRDIAISDEIR